MNTEKKYPLSPTGQSSRSNVIETNDLKTPVEVGNHYRLIGMTGKLKGRVFFLIGKRIVIGRGDQSDIQIIDPNVSRSHAELILTENAYTISDLGTDNGIVVGDQKIKQKRLFNNDKIVIGQVVFKYNEFKNLPIKIAPENTQPESFEGLNQKLNQLKAEAKDKLLKNQKNKIAPNKKNLFIISLVSIIAIFFLFNDDPPKIIEKKKVANNFSDLNEEFSNLIPKKNTEDDPESKKQLNSLIHAGRREFSEGNYFRAMEDFRLALLISPHHGHVSYYLSKSKQRLDEEIEKNFIKGKQEIDSKKFQSSIVSFCSVIQLLQNYPNDERYKNAILKLNGIEQTLGMEKGEIKCFEEKSTDSGS